MTGLLHQIQELHKKTEQIPKSGNAFDHTLSKLLKIFDLNFTLIPQQTQFMQDQQNRYFDQLQTMWREVKSNQDKDASRVDNSFLLLETQTANRHLQEENVLLLNQLNELTVENRNLHKKLQTIEDSLDDLYQQRMTMASTRTELDMLKSDIERLTLLLSKTEEYKDVFSSGQQLTYLKKTGKVENVKNSKSTQRVKFSSMEDNEKFKWVPVQALEVLKKYDLSEQDKSQLLMSINQVFHEQWSSKLTRQQKQSDQEIQSLKRLTQSRQRSENHQISRRNQSTQSPTMKTQKIRRLDDQGTQFDGNIILNPEVNENQDERYLLEIRELQQTIQDLQSTISDLKRKPEMVNQSVDYSRKSEDKAQKKATFLKGALWIVEQILQEVETQKSEIYRLEDEIAFRIETLMESQDTVQQQIVMRVYRWLSEVMHSSQNNFFEKINGIARATQQKLKQ